jgi:GTP-binding protein
LKKNLEVHSAVKPEDYPQDMIPEIAIVGRSNAGKSSMINALLNRKIAYVSQKPGKTVTLNFFPGKSYRLVDMPGYGYAKRSNAETEGWQEMIELYVSSRENLKGLILVIDYKREWTAEEERLKLWCEHYELPMLVAVNKVDQLNRQDKLKVEDYFLKTSYVPVFLTSALKNEGVKELENYAFKEWVRE